MVEYLIIMATPQETRPPANVFEGVVTFINADPKKRMEMLGHIGMPALIDSADRILSQAPVIWEPGAQDVYLSAKRQNLTIINIFSHQIHLDALKAAQVAEEQRILEAENDVRNLTKGNIITLAKSVAEGHQGPLL